MPVILILGLLAKPPWPSKLFVGVVANMQVDWSPQRLEGDDHIDIGYLNKVSPSWLNRSLHTAIVGF